MYPSPAVSVPEPAKPDAALFSSQQLAATTYEGVKTAGKRHALAVEAAKTAAPGRTGLIPENLVTEVLNAGSALDRALIAAVNCGYSIETLSAISDVHPMYIDILVTDMRPL